MSTEPKILSSRGKDRLATPSPDGLGLALQASGKSYFCLALSKVFLSPCCKQLIRRTAGALARCFWGWMVLMESTSDVLGQRCSWCCSKAGTGNGGSWPALSCWETPQQGSACTAPGEGRLSKC